MTKLSLQNYLDQIDNLIEESKLDEAIAHCRHILTFYPRNIAAYKLLGKAHLELRNYDDAIDLFQRVLSADPNDLVAHIALSMIHKERDESELSLWHLERAFEIQPYNEAIREELRLLYIRFNDEVPQRLPLTSGAVARLYIRGELYQQAVQTLEPVVSESQDRLDLEVLLAEALWQGRDDQRIDAEKVCLNVLERLPNSVVANSILATIWLRTGRIGESQKYLARVQDLTCLDHKSIDSETPIGRAFLTDGAPSLPEEITLQWLDDMPAPQQAQLSSADWMSEMNTDLSDEPPVSEGTVIEEGESGMHSYDWMMDVEDEQAPDLAADTMAAGAVMTDWFAEGEDNNTIDSEPTPPTPAEEVPDWLGDLSDDSAADDYDFLDSDSGAAGTDSSLGTNWFTDEAIEAASDAMVDSDVPDWLAGLDDDGELKDTPVAEEPIQEEESLQMDAPAEGMSDMPDWLATETDDLKPLEADANDGSPDWLGDSLSDELEPIQMDASEADNWLDDLPDEAGADMKKDSATEASEDEFDFLNMPSDDGSGDEDWLSELGDDSTENDDALLAFDSEAEATPDDEWELVGEEQDSNASLMSDWLTDEEDDDTTTPETAVAEAGVSDWLSEPSDSLEDSSESDAVQSVTSWLADLDEGDSLGDSAASESPLDIPEPDDDWLNETRLLTTDEDKSAVESMTSWLTSLDEDDDSSSEETASALEVDDVDDDWLKETSLLEDVGKVAGAVAVTNTVSDWLSDEEDDEDTSDPTSEDDSDLFADLAMEAESTMASIEGAGEDDSLFDDDDLFADLEDEPDTAVAETSEADDDFSLFGDNDLFAEEDPALDTAVAETSEADDDFSLFGDDDLFAEEDPALDTAVTETSETDDDLSLFGDDDLFAEEDPALDTAVAADDNLSLFDDEQAETAEPPKPAAADSDWLSKLPDSSEQSAVAGELGTNWLTEDASDDLFALSDDDLEIPDLDSGLLSIDSDLVVEDDDDDIIEEAIKAPEEGADDWLSVLTQDDFDTNELEELPPEVISEYESEIEEETMEDEDWSSLMYGTDALGGTTLEETGALESDFPSALSDEDLQNSQYDDIPDWLTSGPLDLDETPVPSESGEPIHPGDMLDEDDFVPAAADSDWEEESALDWISHLSESEEGVSTGDDEALSPDLAEFDALVDKPGAGPISTAELLGLDNDELPDWMEGESAQVGAVPVEEPAAAQEDDTDVTGFTDLFGWDDDGTESSDTIEDDTAVAESFNVQEEPEETLSGLLGWNDKEDATTEDDDFLPQLDDLDGLASGDEESPEEEISATELFADTDLFAEDASLDDVLADDTFDFDLDAEDEEFEIDGSGLTDLLSGTSLGQSGALDLDDDLEQQPGKTTAEFESALPELLPSDQTSWLDQLGGTDNIPEDKPEDKEKVSLDWLAQTGGLPEEFDSLPEEDAEESVTDFLNDAESLLEEDFIPEQELEEDFDIGEDAQLEDIDDPMSWLEDLASQQDTPIEELPSVAQNAFEDDVANYLEEEQSDEDDLDWLADAEPIAAVTPSIEDASGDDEVDLDAPPEDLDGAMAWLGELTEQHSSQEDDTLLSSPETFDEDVISEADSQTDALLDVETDLNDAMSWLDEISAEPDDGLEAPEDVNLGEQSPVAEETVQEEETVLDEMQLLDLVESELEEAKAVEDPELSEALDWLEQQVLSEGISVVIASENAPTVSDTELDSALNWLETQLSQQETTIASTLPDEDIDFVEEVDGFATEGDVPLLPDAEMLTGPLDDADVNLFDMPDDPTDAMAWLESMVASDGELDIESDLPPIKPSEDAVYIDESLYGPIDEPEDEPQADEAAVDDVDMLEELEALVEDVIDTAITEEPAVDLDEEPQLDLDEEPELDLGLDAFDEDDPEAMFAALLAGDMEIETDLPPIKPSEDAVYVDESLYASSSTQETTEEVIEEDDLLAAVIDDLPEEPTLDLDEEPELDLGLDAFDEDDPEALFAALLAGDMEIETDLPPIKPSEDAVYVDESLYASSSTQETTEEVIEEDDLLAAVIDDLPEEPTLDLDEEPEFDLGLDALDEDDPEAMFAALLAGDIDIETDLPPIKPSEDAVYVDESLYASSSTQETAEEEVEEVIEEDDLLASVIDDLPEELELDLGLDGLDEDDPEAMFAALLAGDIDIETDLPSIKPSEDAVYVDESLYASSAKTEETAESTDAVDDLLELDVPDDPDEAVAWLTAMAQEDGALDIETDLPPIKPSEDAVYVDESLYASSSDTAVDEEIVEDVPDDPDEAVAWLGKMAEQQASDTTEEPAPSVIEDDSDTEMLPSWMLGDTDDLELDMDFDDILEDGDEDLSISEIDADATPDEILDESLGSPIDEVVHDSLPSWLEVDQDSPPVGGETGWLRTLSDLDVDSWLAAEEEATVRGFDEPTPLPVTSELSPTPSITSELAEPEDESQDSIFEEDDDEEDFLVVEPDSSVSMYSIDENELKEAQDALLAENHQEAAAKYHDLVSKGGGIMILIAELETAAEQNPDHPEFRRLLGDAYMRNGQLQKALDTYKDALNKL